MGNYLPSIYNTLNSSPNTLNKMLRKRKGCEGFFVCLFGRLVSLVCNVRQADLKVMVIFPSQLHEYYGHRHVLPGPVIAMNFNLITATQKNLELITYLSEYWIFP